MRLHGRSGGEANAEAPSSALPGPLPALPGKQRALKAAAAGSQGYDNPQPFLKALWRMVQAGEGAVRVMNAHEIVRYFQAVLCENVRAKRPRYAPAFSLDPD